MTTILRFDLELTPDPDGSATVSGLQRGHLTISGSRGLVTSRGRRPDQSVMIFLSIVELLDGLRRFARRPHLESYEFVGVDSSFRLSLRRLPGGLVRLASGGTVIDEVELPRSSGPCRRAWVPFLPATAGTSARKTRCSTT